MFVTALFLFFASPHAAAAFASMPPAVEAARATRVFAIQADKLVFGDGRTVENGVIVVEDRMIRAVGAGVEIPKDAAVITHHGVASAGLIGLHAYAGAPAEMFDSTR